MEERKHVNLVGPTVLILVGIVLLLNNLGWTQINVWDLVRLWPVLLIAGGVELLIGQRSRLGSVIVLGVMLALLAGGLWMLTESTPVASTEGQEISVPLEEAERAEIEIGFGVGTLQIGSMSEPDVLLNGTIELHRGERLERDVDLSADRAYVNLQSRADWPVPLFGLEGDRHWSLNLYRGIPVDLRVDAGVGDAHIDLRRMDLIGFTAKMGLGRAIVILPASGVVEADIDGGVGDLVVEVPEGTAVRVQASTGLGHTSVPASYRRDGDSYVSPGYDSSESQIDLVIESGVGRILIRPYVGE